MDIDRLRKEIGDDEGRVNEIYLDHMGFPTFGIGHLVLKTDPEYGMPVGTPVDDDRVDEAFDNDVESVLRDCGKLYPDFDDLPEEVQLIVANMMFNMGLTRLKNFKGMKRNIDSGNFDGAADEMVDSAWYKQVPKRAKRLAARMRNV